MSQQEAADARRARHAVLRTVLVWTPFFVLFAAVAVSLLVDATSGNGGAWFGFAITALLGLLTGFQSLAGFRDLFAEPVETTGIIQRKWRKSDMFFFRGHYLLVRKRVFRVMPDVYEAMPPEGGRVYLYHYPHTNALVTWRTVSEPELEEDEGPTADPEAEAPTPRPAFTPSPERVEPPRFERPRDGEDE